MKELFISALIAIQSFLGFGGDKFGATVLTVPQGGTGASTFTAGECLVGNGTGAITTAACGASSGGSGTISTSSVPTVGNLSYWTDWNTLGSVATSSKTCTAPLSCTGFDVVGSGSGAITLDTTGLTNYGKAWEIDGSGFLAPTTTLGVKITNTGAGDSFVVEDSASTDTTPFVITAAGNVGIGTNNPGATLEVNGNIRANALYGYTGGSASHLNLYSPGFSIVARNQLSINSGLVFQGGSLTTANNQNLTITPQSGYNTLITSGNVGIGTTGPGYNLDIQQNAANNGFVGVNTKETGNTSAAIIGNLKASDGTYTLPGIWFGQGGAITPSFTNYAFLKDGSGTYFNTPSSQVIQFRVNNANKMTIDAAGNVGIGTTSPVEKLDVNGNLRIENQGQLKFGELRENGNHSATLSATSSMATDVNWTLPAADGASGQILTTNGGGNLYWKDDASRGAPTVVNQTTPNYHDSLDSGWFDWHGNGTVAHDSSIFAEGTASLRLDLGAASVLTGARKNIADVDWSQENFRIFVRSNDWANVDSASILVSTSGMFDAYYILDLKNFLVSPENNEWIEVVFTRSDFYVGGGSPSWTTANDMILRGTSPSGTASLWYDGFSAIPSSPRGVVSFTFDDGVDDGFNEGRKKLDEYGYKATAYIIPETIGDAGYMTQAELEQLKQKGWEVSMHSVNNLTALSAAELVAELDEIAAYRARYGFDDGFAYPNGDVNESVLDEVKKRFSYGRNITWLRQSSTFYSQYQINAVSPLNTTSTSTLFSMIDAAYNNGDHLILNFHHLVASASASTDYSILGFSEIVDYVNSKGMPVLPVNQVIRGNMDGLGTANLFAHSASSTLFTATTAWLTNLFIGAVDIAEYIADTAGAMFTGNTETGITVTYQDADNTIDVVCDTANGSTFGCLSSTDWTTFNNKQSALTFSYPLINTGGTISTAFGTTTNNVFSGSNDFGGATFLEIPNGTNPTANDPGEIAHDTTDNQLILDDKVIPTTFKLAGRTVASTSPAFINAETMPLSTQLDGFTITRIQCTVDGGTSKVIAIEDASGNSSEDITCGTTLTTDDGSITNATYTAGEEWYIDFGATSGAVNYVSISVFGTWARE
jgi:peptidoglycan/xylan/chitin deacetylase (PgdA/CDA1 family)